MTLTATERDLVDAASRWFDAHRAQFVDELCELLRYPSVSDESDPNPRPGAPYGPEVRRVFDHMLAKAGRDGLPTRDYTGHVWKSFIHRRTWRPTVTSPSSTTST